MGKKDIVIATKEEAYWTICRDNLKKEVKEYEDALKYSKATLEMCEKKVQESK